MLNFAVLESDIEHFQNSCCIRELVFNYILGPWQYLTGSKRTKTLAAVPCSDHRLLCSVAFSFSEKAVIRGLGS